MLLTQHTLYSPHQKKKKHYPEICLLVLLFPSHSEFKIMYLSSGGKKNKPNQKTKEYEQNKISSEVVIFTLISSYSGNYSTSMLTRIFGGETTHESLYGIWKVNSVGIFSNTNNQCRFSFTKKTFFLSLQSSWTVFWCSLTPVYHSNGHSMQFQHLLALNLLTSLSSTPFSSTPTVNSLICGTVAAAWRSQTESTLE